MKFQTAFSQVAVLSVASAHSIFTYFEAEGTTYPASYGIRDPSYDGPINDVTTTPMACNGGPNPTTASPYVINVKAGDTINAIWRHTLTSTEENDSIYVIDPSHKGPTLAYLKKVDDALTDDGIGNGWFKIQAAGLTNVATQDWAITVANQGMQAITIPTCIANGQYLLRAELIALHAASAPLGAQFYMECAQINVTGGTGAATPSTVAFPGAYGQSDPGILINIYQTLTTYAIPGPTPFVCGAGGASPTTVSSSSAKPTSKATSTTLVTSVKSSTTTSSSKAATSTPSGAGSPLYGQCGGTG
ncbi:putative endo-beta-1 [Hyphodiscus hymeniophilus]|uniref:AA9 family lytic polysaccharide monooxygenase n=1 Tax=Hyphodiscus hymeniophilus TaxID=353542 RepID=A0A9P6SPP1_9HELO|nr:putative endo-beta-1 [Hyphodiscus hymeniophilus]